MEKIPPYQITSEILNLINEANEYLILVSPYVNFNNWDRIKTDIKKALKRNVKIYFYVRLDSDNFKSWEQIEALGIKPIFIKNLHAKLYFNEKSGIVTSMNLLTSSKLTEIEFGAIYNSEDELNELKIFVKKLLDSNLENEKPSDDDIYLAKEKFHLIIQNVLSNILKIRVYCKWQNGNLIVNANNQFILEMDKVKHIFSITGLISELEADNFDSFLKSTNFKNAQINLIRGKNNTLSSIDVFSKKTFSKDNYDFLSVSEKKEILDMIVDFVCDLKEYKSECYRNKKANK